MNSLSNGVQRLAIHSQLIGLKTLLKISNTFGK